MARETLLLVDGHSLVYRAFYAMPALANSRGEMTNAAYGFTSMLLKALADIRPQHAVAAFDPPGRTFRHDADATYKAQRKETPEELRPQFAWCREVVQALNIPIVEVATFEADDVIGTLAVQGERAGLDVVIVTGDLDMLQLVTDHVRVFANRRGITETTIYDVAAVRERYGFDPPQVVDFKALQGDVSDNIPGVPGIGAKTAMALIAEHGALEQIIAAVPSMKEGKVKRLLGEYEEQARLSKQLATIRCDVAVDLDLAHARLGGYDDAVVRETFDRLEFRSLLARLPEVEATGTVGPAGPSLAEPVEAVDAVAVDVITEAGDAQEMVARLREAGHIGLRTVLAGSARRGDIIGVALCAVESPDPAYYVPVAHEGLLGNARFDAVSVLGPLLADPTVRITGYDLKAELLAWSAHGVAVTSLDFDEMLAAYLCITTRARVPALPVLAQDLCGASLQPEESLLGTARSRRTSDAVPVEEAAPYWGNWVAALGPVRTALERSLAEGTLRSLYDELEMPLIPILAAMERVGIRVDCDRLGQLSRELYDRITELEAAVGETAGYTFNLGSTQQLATFLYDELGLAAGRKTKTGRSTDADSLEALRSEHSVVDKVLEWRQLTKLKGTYVDALPLLCAADSRIHTTFNQAVATTGRLSSADPNLQNVPVRTEWGGRIRHAFVADSGFRLVSADYSQIELRVLAHVSGEKGLIDAFDRNEDIHRRTAAQVYGVAPEEVTPDMRRIAKVVNFGVVYGLSDFGLSRDTGMAQEDARDFIKAYFESFPAVTDYLEKTRMHAREWGWVETFMGRRRHLPDIRAANRQLRSAAERMAVNMPIQGAAADIMKKAMIQVAGALQTSETACRLLLQVHDELVLEAPVDEVEAVIELVRGEMERACDLVVPLVVDVKVGDNWQEMTPVPKAVAGVGA